MRQMKKSESGAPCLLNAQTYWYSHVKLLVGHKVSYLQLASVLSIVVKGKIEFLISMLLLIKVKTEIYQ